MDIGIKRLGDTERAGIIREGRYERLEAVEVAVNPTIPVRLLKEDRSRSITIIETAKAELDRGITEYIQAAQDLDPDQPHLHIQVRADPCCLAADNPAGPVYDPPSYWDDDAGRVVIPEGAVRVNETEPHIGWVLFTIIVVKACDAPLCASYERVGPDSHFFWTTPFVLDEDSLPERLASFRGRALIAAEASKTFDFGNKPEEPL